MMTILKLNLLTDDEELPTNLREAAIGWLRDIVRNDPEGHEHAHVSLEWKHTLHNRDYMASLPTTPRVERIVLPTAPERPAKSTKKKPATRGARA